MPILKQEPDLYPANLLESFLASELSGGRWWAMYTVSRREKQLMRLLLSLGISFYGPTICRRYRSPNGRLRESFEPLFSNYVFLYGREEQRLEALTTNCVSKSIPVPDGIELARDLHQIHQLIETGEPLTPEARLVPGDPVRVKSGVFAGFEGVVIRRQNEVRLLVAVNFMQQGASVLVDDCQVEQLR